MCADKFVAAVAERDTKPVEFGLEFDADARRAPAPLPGLVIDNSDSREETSNDVISLKDWFHGEKYSLAETVLVGDGKGGVGGWTMCGWTVLLISSTFLNAPRVIMYVSAAENVFVLMN